MILKCDGAGNITKTFFRISHAEILIKGLITINRRLIHTLATTHIICSTITLETTVVGSTWTTGRIVGTITFNNVVFNQRTSCPTIQSQIRILWIADAIIARITDHSWTTTRVPPLSAYPVIGIVCPLRGISPTGLQCHRRTTRIFPESIIKSVIGSCGIGTQCLCINSCTYGCTENCHE